MQFSKIRLLGFKSFVDPTEMIIASGLTGIVGPNGCGKSNLLEAIRWVMGENRASAMRGGGMEDVIFAGSTSRPARNFAEVTLQLDNTDRLAPAGFNDADNLEIVRRITRDAGSAYKTNGKEARARDVQMLFADASTGAHSPALVRQGQISELINAKPKARRRILEEAAGISGLYQRRHEAELKLRGAETNLTRVDDVIEALQAQLNTLARQARQAARYREIATELRRSEGLLLYRRWREADLEKMVVADALRVSITDAATAQGIASRAGRDRVTAEENVPPLREEEAIAGAVLQRLHVERDTLTDQENRARQAISALGARIDQLSKDAERETALNRDAKDMMAQLEWEQDALTKASLGQEDKLAEAVALAQEAAAGLREEESGFDKLTEDAARLSARHQTATRRLEDAQTQTIRVKEAGEQAENAIRETTAELGASEAQLRQAEAEQVRTTDAAERSEEELAQAETARSNAQTSESAARGVLAEAEGEATALSAEVGALERLIAREKGDTPQLLDQIRVAPGFEAALGAALADDLRAPLIEGDTASGWYPLSDYAQTTSLPEGAARLAEHIVAPPVLARRLAAIGLVARSEGPRLQSDLSPGQRLVSVEGDLWRWDGYRAHAEDAPSAAAVRLQQINRLTELSETLKAAQQKAETAKAAYAAQRDILQAAQVTEQTARTTRRDADTATTLAMRNTSRAEADANMLTARLDTVRLALTRHLEEAELADTAARDAQLAISELGDLQSARDAVEKCKVSVEAARLTMISKRSMSDELRRDGDARLRRSQEITKEASGWKLRLANADNRVVELETRIVENQEELKAAKAAPDEITQKRDALSVQVDTAEQRRKTAADALAKGETALREAEATERTTERNASDAREARARAQAMSEAAGAREAVAAERITEELEVTPQTLLETLQADPDDMPTAEAIEADVIRLRRQRDALGAVNLRAEEDAREVQEEFTSLTGEKNDLESAIEKLRHGIANLNKEGRQRLLAAFDEVNTNFAKLFKSLFGGGDANLVLVESDDPLEAGLEIMCQPPGKKLSTLSLLSGGEQTLTAMSLIFAVFLANPSPICVLDEVDAPLDDANVTRFCDLLDEMTEQTDTRFLIITHHAVTMARMDRLFGVTMAEQGISQLVSVDLRQAETLVDA